ncbi:MAG: DUF308 domain-containing protein [Roseburia sp.]|nr:DUF308 domain-containing protein [Roseburia sp.]
MDKNNVREWFKNNLGIMVISLCQLVIGILLFVDYIGFTNGIIITCGAIMLILGVIQVLKYFTSKIEVAKTERALFNGLLLLIIGAFCAFNSKWFIEIISVISILYGVVLVLLSLNSIQAMTTLLRLKNKKWFLELINAVVLITFAVIIFANPFGAGKGIWIFTGIVLMVSAIYNIVKTVCMSMPQKQKPVSVKQVSGDPDRQEEAASDAKNKTSK